MPATKYMTGDVFTGTLLDAFFNLFGTLTDQSILLIGMMTRGHPRCRFLSDRDLALENVRYVLQAWGGYSENFRPPRAGSSQRAQQVLAKSVDLLRRITAEGLLNAIADGTFGNPPPGDGGRGLDGLIERADGYFNPASEFLEGQEQFLEAGGHDGTSRPDGDPATRDTTGDERIQFSFTLPLPSGARRAGAGEGAAARLAAKMGLEPAVVVRAKAMGPDFTFFIVYGTVRRLVDLAEIKVAARVSARCPQPRSTSDPVGPRPGTGRGRRNGGCRRAARRHRRHPERQGPRSKGLECCTEIRW